LKRGLTGHVQIAAIPTALAMTAMLTTPYRAKHPEVRFTIVSRGGPGQPALAGRAAVLRRPGSPRSRRRWHGGPDADAYLECRLTQRARRPFKVTCSF
jgi:hypothetical protein